MKKINYFWIAFLFLFGIATGYFGKKYWNYKEKTNPKTHSSKEDKSKALIWVDKAIKDYLNGYYKRKQFN